MKKNKNLVSYYNVYFNGEYSDLIDIRYKYSFNTFKINSAVYTSLCDMLEYAVRFGKKYKKKKDLLNDLSKIEFQAKKIYNKMLELHDIKQLSKQSIIDKLLNKLFRKKKHFLIEVSKDYKTNETVISDFIYQNDFYNNNCKCLINAIVNLDYRSLGFWIKELKKDIEKLDI